MSGLNASEPMDSVIASIDRGDADVLGVAREVAAILAEHAPAVDERGEFPAAGLAALKSSGLMGLIVPRAYGGWGADYHTMSQVARILAGSCMSTSMIWSMHCQQVATLNDFGADALKERVLTRVAAEGLFIASVTTEREKGGHLLSAHAPLIWDGETVELVRDAPVVTGGAYGDCYLITMRIDSDSTPSDVALVYADRDQLETEVKSNWNSLGVRGTHSVGMSLHGTLPKDQVLTPPGGFKQLAVRTMVPVGHIAWASSWLGATEGALNQVMAVLRNPKLRSGYDVQSDLFAERLARIRLKIDTVRVYLDWLIDEYQRVLADPETCDIVCRSPGFNIHIGNLKILASELCFEAVDKLVQLAGLRYGYLKNSHVTLERTFRDLRSASLMYANDRLLVSNGKLTLIDREAV